MNRVLAEYLARFPNDGYLRYHAPRYELALEMAKPFCGPGSRVLDIGRSRFAGMLAEWLQTDVDTLGLEPDGPTESGRHFNYDLNEAIDPAAWRTDLERYDLILFCEVLEHLYTSPRPVLSFVRSLMRDGAHLILQTPNATVLHKRLQFLIGRQPFQLISETRGNPGHFREYTRRELSGYVNQAGFELVSFRYGNYFDYRYADHLDHQVHERPRWGWLNRLYSILPGSFKPGMTFVLRAPAGRSARTSS